MARRQWPLTCLAVALPPAVCAAVLPLRSIVPAAWVAVLLVAVVAVAGTVGPWATPVLVAASAAVAFDVLRVEPYGSLEAHRPAELATGVVVMVVGAALAGLARRRRVIRFVSNGGVDSGPLVAVGRVAEDIAEGDSSGFVILEVARSLTDLFGLLDCRFEVAPFDSRRLPTLLRTGEIELGPECWDPCKVGLPPTGFGVAVVARGEMRGRFVCIPGRRRRLPRRQQVAVALTLADQAASALLLESVA